MRKLDPPVRAALRLGAYQLGYLDDARRTRPPTSRSSSCARARLERAVPFTNAVMRRLAEGMRCAARLAPRTAPLKDSYPDWIAETFGARPRPRRRARADARAERAARRRSSGSSAATLDGEPTDIPGAFRVDRVDDGASRRAGSGRRAAARSSPGSSSARSDGRARARPLRRAGRQGDDAARRGHRGRARPEPRARARGERRAARRDERHASSAPTARSCPPELDGFDRALVDAPCSGLGVLAAATRPALARARRCRSSSSSCCAPRPSASSPAGRSSTRSARSTPTRTRRSSTRPASRSMPLGDEWPQFAPPAPPGVPAHAAARPRHERVLHRRLARSRSRA